MNHTRSKLLPAVQSLLFAQWKRLPSPVRRRFHLLVTPVLKMFTPVRILRWWRKGAPPREPVVVAGLHASVIGLGQGARLFTEALRQAGLDVRPVDLCQDLSVPETLPRPARAPEAEGGVLVSHFNPPELLFYLYRRGGRLLGRKRHIGYWAWELPKAPVAWKAALRYVDEVWCPSEFTAVAVRDLGEGRVPVKVVPHPIFVVPRPPPDRPRFALPDGACVVLVAFDLRSTAARKNPFGALEAYERAFPAPNGAALLVCKVVGAAAAPDPDEALRLRAARREDVRLLNQDLSEEDMLALVASSDVILSLHRAEGFGLLMAQAMWLGRAVVATAWSGNMDYMDADSAALVDWTYVAADDPQGMYSGAQWAEPDLDQAARLLRNLAFDPRARHDLAERARRKAEQAFDPARWLENVLPGLLGPPETSGDGFDNMPDAPQLGGSLLTRLSWPTPG